MCELFIELLTARLQHDPVPCNLLHTLGREGGGVQLFTSTLQASLGNFTLTRTIFDYPKKVVYRFFEMKIRDFFHEIVPRDVN